jgi:hypothetical protein
MNNSLIYSNNKSQIKNNSIIDKNEIFSEFNNLHRAKQSSKKSDYYKSIENESKNKQILHKTPSSKKNINENQQINKITDPKKIQWSSLKNGMIYHGRLYNSMMESIIYFFYLFDSYINY